MQSRWSLVYGFKFFPHFGPKAFISWLFLSFKGIPLFSKWTTFFLFQTVPAFFVVHEPAFEICFGSWYYPLEMDEYTSACGCLWRMGNWHELVVLRTCLSLLRTVCTFHWHFTNVQVNTPGIRVSLLTDCLLLTNCLLLEMHKQRENSVKPNAHTTLQVRSECATRYVTQLSWAGVAEWLTLLSCGMNGHGFESTPILVGTWSASTWIEKA